MWDPALAQVNDGHEKKLKLREFVEEDCFPWTLPKEGWQLMYIGKTIINHPFGNGLYHLLYLWWFWGWFIIVLPCFTHITPHLINLMADHHDSPWKLRKKCQSNDLLTPPCSVPEDYVDTRVEGLSERPVQSMDDVEELLEEGNKRRQGLELETTTGWTGNSKLDGATGFISPSWIGGQPVMGQDWSHEGLIWFRVSLRRLCIMCHQAAHMSGCINQGTWSTWILRSLANQYKILQYNIMYMNGDIIFFHPHFKN